MTPGEQIGFGVRLGIGIAIGLLLVGGLATWLSQPGPSEAALRERQYERARSYRGPAAPSAPSNVVTARALCASVLNPACRCAMVARDTAGLLDDAIVTQVLTPDPEIGGGSVAIFNEVPYRDTVIRYRHACTFDDDRFSGIPKATWKLLPSE
ncbi:MAG: hypothetical protein OHK0024_21240 [Thalassobaculales bacterium]